MKIGIAGPIDLTLLDALFAPESNIPPTYSFALTANLARALYSRGHEITLFALSREVTETRRIDGDQMTAYICPQRRPRSQMLDFFRGERHALRDAMRASRCCVIHAHWTYEFGSAAVQSGLPHVITAHDVPTKVMKFAQHPYWLVKPLLAWSVLRNAKCVTAVSPYVAHALRRFVNPKHEIIVIPNGVPQDAFDLFRVPTSRSESGTFTFASVLNEWSGRKNGERLIKAFGLIREEFGERVRLQMYGNQHGKDGPAHRWSMRRRLDEGIEFIGPLPNGSLVRRLAKEVDVLVHPALEEAHCMAINEAMAIGIPVIAGVHSGGVPWGLANGQAGMLVDVTSTREIARGMRAMINDGHLRKTLGEAGREKAARDYQLDAVATQYEHVLEAALREQAH